MALAAYHISKRWVIRGAQRLCRSSEQEICNNAGSTPPWSQLYLQSPPASTTIIWSLIKMIKSYLDNNDPTFRRSNDISLLFSRRLMRCDVILKVWRAHQHSLEQSAHPARPMPSLARRSLSASGSSPGVRSTAAVTTTYKVCRKLHVIEKKRLTMHVQHCHQHSTAWQQPVTEHVSAAAEDSSVWTVMNATRRRCGVSLWFWRRI